MEACAHENNHHRGVNQSYIRVLEMSKGTMDMEQATSTYEGIVPKADKYYLPVQCQQCDNPPSVIEWKVSAGVWAFGLMILTVLLKLALIIF